MEEYHKLSPVIQGLGIGHVCRIPEGMPVYGLCVLPVEVVVTWITFNDDDKWRNEFFEPLLHLISVVSIAVCRSWRSSDYKQYIVSVVFGFYNFNIWVK